MGAEKLKEEITALLDTNSENTLKLVKEFLEKPPTGEMDPLMKRVLKASQAEARAGLVYSNEEVNADDAEWMNEE